MGWRPGAALLIILTLGLGIGGNTVVFSVMHAVLLRPLPLPNAERLVWVWERDFNGTPTASVSPADFRDYVTAALPAFEELAAIGLLAEGAAVEDAEMALAGVAQRLEAAYPETNTDWYPIVQDLRSIDRTRQAPASTNRESGKSLDPSWFSVILP